MRERETNIRIPFRVESPRGDDRLGTNTNTGQVVSDHEAEKQGVPFEPDVPKEQIQHAVEGQLKADKWVCLEGQDGTTDLLTKKDIPQKDDWKTAFNMNPPVNPAPTPSKPTATTCGIPTPKPTSPKEVWESKFESIKSATATHKGKGG